jgi:transposase
MRYIGVDLHTTQLTVCYRDGAGVEQLEMFKIDLVDKFISSLNAGDKVAYEATGNSLFLYKKLLPVIGEENITVVNTSRFKLISKSVKKTDSNDSKLLAEYLSKDMLPKARLKNDFDTRVYALIETRDNLVKGTTAFKNQIHNIFVQHGIKLKAKCVANEKNLCALLESYTFDETTMFHLEVAKKGIVQNMALSNEIEAKLHELKSQMGQIENLTSICGIGVKSAMGIKAVIGDVNNFEDEDKLVAYAGLCPRVHNSNETVSHGGITKMGNKLMRKLLVQCAWVSIKYNPIMKAQYEKLRKRKPAGVAIIAIARKLLIQIYYTLKYNWYFNDTANTQKEIKVFA